MYAILVYFCDVMLVMFIVTISYLFLMMIWQNKYGVLFQVTS